MDETNPSICRAYDDNSNEMLIACVLVAGVVGLLALLVFVHFDRKRKEDELWKIRLNELEFGSPPGSPPEIIGRGVSCQVCQRLLFYSLKSHGPGIFSSVDVWSCFAGRVPWNASRCEACVPSKQKTSNGTKNRFAPNSRDDLELQMHGGSRNKPVASQNVLNSGDVMSYFNG